jgi:hypothetical protein
MMFISSWPDAVECQACSNATPGTFVSKYEPHSCLLTAGPLGLPAAGGFGCEHLKKVITHHHTGKPHPEGPVPPPPQVPPATGKGVQGIMTKHPARRGRKPRFNYAQQKRRWNGWLWIGAVTTDYCINNGLPLSDSYCHIFMPAGYAGHSLPPLPPNSESDTTVNQCYYYQWLSVTSDQLKAMSLPTVNTNITNQSGTHLQKLACWSVCVAFLKQCNTNGLFFHLGYPHSISRNTPPNDGMNINYLYE